MDETPEQLQADIDAAASVAEVEAAQAAASAELAAQAAAQLIADEQRNAADLLEQERARINQAIEGMASVEERVTWLVTTLETTQAQMMQMGEAVSSQASQLQILAERLPPPEPTMTAEEIAAAEATRLSAEADQEAARTQQANQPPPRRKVRLI